MGDSTFKCDSCIKSLRSQRRDDTPVKTRSGSSTLVECASPTKIISPERSLVLPPISDGDKNEAQIVQLETIRLNALNAVELLKSLSGLVNKLSEYDTHLKSGIESSIEYITKIS
jgi:hypothetical protein